MPSLSPLPSPSASNVHLLFISLFIVLFHCSFTVHPRINNATAYSLGALIDHALRQSLITPLIGQLEALSTSQLAVCTLHTANFSTGGPDKSLIAIARHQQPSLPGGNSYPVLDPDQVASWESQLIAFY